MALTIAFGRYWTIRGGRLDQQQLVEATGELKPQAAERLSIIPLVTVDVEQIPPGYTERGTAFQLGNGLWFTARHVAQNGCGRVILIVQGTIVPAQVKFLDANADIAILKADIHSGVGLPIGARVRADESAFAFGFPQGTLGGTEDELLGRTHLRLGGRLSGTAAVLAWVETKRYPAELDSLAGISGGPMLDSEGNVVGIFVAASVRRGRNYTVAPEILAAIEHRLGTKASQAAAREVLVRPLSLDIAADQLSKSARIAEVYCIPR